MASAGPNLPGTARSGVKIYGLYDWTNPDNVKADDSVYASATYDNTGGTKALVGTNFGFPIPTDATINGIAVEWKRYANSTGVWTQACLQKDDTHDSSNKADYSSWPQSPGVQTLGGSNDLWGLSWTAAQINASTFGFWTLYAGGPSGGATAYIDYYKITVYYTPSGGNVKFCSVVCSKFNGVAVSKFDGVA